MLMTKHFVCFPIIFFLYIFVRHRIYVSENQKQHLIITSHHYCVVMVVINSFEKKGRREKNVIAIRVCVFSIEKSHCQVHCNIKHDQGLSIYTVMTDGLDVLYLS